MGFLGVWIPGPDMLLIFRNSYLYGKRKALLSLLGILTGNIIYLLPVFLGFVYIFEKLFPALFLLGGFYLLYTGVIQLFSEIPIHSENLKNQNQNFYISGLLTNLSNPKAMLYFATILLPSLKNIENLLLNFTNFFIGVIMAFLSIIFLANILQKFFFRLFKFINIIISLFFIIYSVFLLKEFFHYFQSYLPRWGIFL